MNTQPRPGKVGTKQAIYIDLERSGYTQLVIVKGEPTEADAVEIDRLLLAGSFVWFHAGDDRHETDQIIENYINAK